MSAGDEGPRECCWCKSPSYPGKQGTWRPASLRQAVCDGLHPAWRQARVGALGLVRGWSPSVGTDWEGVARKAQRLRPWCLCLGSEDRAGEDVDTAVGEEGGWAGALWHWSPSGLDSEGQELCFSPEAHPACEYLTRPNKTACIINHAVEGLE